MAVHLRSMYVLPAKHLNAIEVMSFSASIQTTVNLPAAGDMGQVAEKAQILH